MKRAGPSVFAAALAAALLLGACASAPPTAPGQAPAAGLAAAATPAPPPAARAVAAQAASVQERAFREFYAARGIPELPSSPPKTYFSSDEWAARALELARGAKDYILISTFLINSHEVNRAILETLARKAAEGVRVYVIFDSSAYFTYMPDMTTFLPTALAYFRGTKVRVAEYNPITGAKLFALPSLFERDHRKFWVVDGERVALGGMNLNYYSLAPSGHYSNIDTFVEIEGAEPARRMVASFCDTWNRNSPGPIEAEDFRIRERPADSSVWLVDQKPGKGSSVDALFDSFFQNAEKELWLLQAYAFTTPALIKKVASATKRGVKVHLALSANSFRLSYDYAAKYCAEDLIEAGASVYMFDPPDHSFLHYKLLLADGRVAAFGSPNYNFRSQYLSRELAVVSADPATAAAAMRNVEGLMRHARPVTLEEAKGYRGPKYLAAYLEMLFGG
ncbi:phosphatidylserine/phosphatidylglycerophosphate/cardiolipin synthase family protein [bacterium]|nr:phosphatidylserine/phosphatidylglycerophosphate/cardiolipin synthase family protein [bacterium]